MKIKEVLAHLESLPKPYEFDWPGPEQWHDGVFDSEVQTLEQAIAYIKALRERVSQQSFALHTLAERYNEIIHWIQEIEMLSS